MWKRFSDYFQEALWVCPDREAIVQGHTRLSYREYAEKIDLAARGLLALGVLPGARVSILLPNIVEYPILFFAIAKIGAVSAHIYTRWKADEIEYALNDAKSKVLFMAPKILNTDYQELLGPVLERCRHLEQVIVMGDDVRIPGMTYEAFLENAQSPREIPGDYQPCDDGEKIATIVYTSGTTGRPKGAMLLEENIIRNGAAWARRLGVRQGFRQALYAPLYHAGPWATGTFFSIYMMGTLILETFDPRSCIQLIEREKIEYIGGVATMYSMMLNHPDIDRYDHSSLKWGVIGGGPVPVDTLRQAKARWGIELFITYGLTETTSGNATTTLPQDTEIHLTETIGKPMEGYRVKIVDENRQDLPAGEIGEIAVNGPIFKGYFNNPEATAKTVDESGWLYTGDLGFVDPDGYFRISGRKDEMYIRGGENVYPTEIEDILYAHPKVLLAAVVPMPHPKWQQAGRAYIVLKEGERCSEQEVLEYCSERTARFKVPEQVVFRKELPLTPTGKVMKKILKREVEEEFL